MYWRSATSQPASASSERGGDAIAGLVHRGDREGAFMGFVRGVTRPLRSACSITTIDGPVNVAPWDRDTMQHHSISSQTFQFV